MIWSKNNLMKIFINADNYKKEAFETASELKKSASKYEIKIADSPSKADVIFSVGGDGTFLKSARLSDGVPIIGINCGTLGFLTEINPEDLNSTLKSILDGKYYVEDRMMLEGEIIKENGETIKIPPALNEIALSKNTFGVVRFDAVVDDKLINSYTADGILVSTPTGSTAYNLSCGGPIADPTANIITLTPIAPHTILNRSIIFSDTSIITVKITELRENTKSFVLYDGFPIEVTTGDVVKIRKSDAITKIIKLNWRSFIDTIRENIK